MGFFSKQFLILYSSVSRWWPHMLEMARLVRPIYAKWKLNSSHSDMIHQSEPALLTIAWPHVSSSCHLPDYPFILCCIFISMCVCLYVCIYVCACVCVSVRVVCVRVVCVCTCVCVCVCVCGVCGVCVYVWCVCTCGVYVWCVCVCLYAYVYVCACVHVCLSPKPALTDAPDRGWLLQHKNPDVIHSDIYKNQ